MSKISRITFSKTFNWTAPAGVTSVLVTPTYNNMGNFSTIDGTIMNLKSVDNLTFGLGAGTNGSSGIGSTGFVSSPTAVVGGLKFVSLGGQLGLPNGQSGGITENGRAYSWGVNTNGQLGVNDTTARSSPTLIVGNLSFSQLYIGTTLTASYGLTSSGKAYAWGINNFGQIGDNTVTPKSSPTAVAGNLTFSQMTVLDIATIGACGLTPSGEIYCWGRNDQGFLGDNTLVNKSSPVLVSGGLTYEKFGYGSTTRTYAITSNGTAYTWGQSSANGSMGIGSFVGFRSSPTAVSGGLSFKKIVFSTNYSYGLTTDGKIYSWGLNTAGELGVNDVTARSSPTLVVGGLTFIDVYATTTSAFGIASDNTLYAWGNNLFGNLGVGDSTVRSSPTIVQGGLKFSTILNGYGNNTNAIFGLTTDNKIYAWGLNTAGQLGLGDATNRSSPVLMTGGLLFKQNEAISPNTFDPVNVPVTPGTAYTVTFNNAGTTFFNSVPVAYGVLDALLLEYEQ